MERKIQAEWLDEMEAEEPGAIGSRRDLQRLNAWMGNAKQLAKILAEILPPRRPRRLLELGAGDGELMLRVAEVLGPGWEGTQIVLLDRQTVPSKETAKRFERQAWCPEFVQAEARQWLQSREGVCWDAVIANLFLHHFRPEQLTELLRHAAKRTGAFIAVEPRRSASSLFSSRLVGLLGCNRVTRHDAPISVRAGFAGQELSGHWPPTDGWKLEERTLGLFMHLFVARRGHKGSPTKSW